MRLDDRLRQGTPELLFEGAYELDNFGNPNYDASPDGERFVMVRNTGKRERDAAQMHVVLNWFSKLERLVPTDN